MKILKTTVDSLNNLKSGEEIESSNIINLELVINNIKYNLSEREGKLRVSVDGQMTISPGGSNMVWISSI